MSFECESLIEYESQVLELVHLLQELTFHSDFWEILLIPLLLEPRHLALLQSKLEVIVPFP